MCRVTLVADPTARRQAVARSGGRLGAAWTAPVWAHLAALSVVLVCLMGVVGTSASFSADEGAAILQATSLAEGRGWVVEHPLPEVDPQGVNYPLELSERGPKGWVPYGKHPLYALLLAGAHGLGGVPAMVLLSLAGTVAAAGLAGALARRLDPGLVRPAIWVVGLSSPLLFDGYLVIAHTLGAALAAAATLATIVAIERRSVRWALAVVPAVAGCVLLRNEGLFMGVALAVVAGAVAVRRRDGRAAAAVAALALVAGGGAHLLDRFWTARVVGGGAVGGSAAPGAGESLGLVEGRVQGLVVTWLTPSYGGRPLTGLALFTMLGAIAFGAYTVHRRPTEGRLIIGSAVVAGAAAVLALLAGPGNVVPGLLLAFPLLAAGLLLISRRTLGSTSARIVGGVPLLFALAVLATQYAKGGGGEWGGRYFALAIPVVVPFILLALRQQRDRLAPHVARVAVAGLVVCSVALSTMGVTALRSSHHGNARLVAAADRAGRAVDAEMPVMVTTEGSMPRFAWSTFDRQRWLLTHPDGLDDLFDRLRGAGVTQVGFVSRNLPRDQARLDAAGAQVVSVDRSVARRWNVLVLRIA